MRYTKLLVEHFAVATVKEHSHPDIFNRAERTQFYILDDSVAYD